MAFVKFYRFNNSLIGTALFVLISKYRFTTNTRISMFFWWTLIIHQPLNRRKLSRPFKIINVVIFLTFNKQKCIFKFCKYSFQNNEWINWDWWITKHGVRETPSWLRCSDIHQREREIRKFIQNIDWINWNWWLPKHSWLMKESDFSSNSFLTSLSRHTPEKEI